MQLFLVNYDTHYEIEQLSRMFFRGLTVTKTDSMPQLPDSEYILIENKGGSFDISASNLTGSIFACYTLGMVGFALLDLMAKAYYAMGKTRVPLIVNLAVIAANFVCNALILRLAPNTAFVAAGTTVVMTLGGAALIAVFFRRSFRVVFSVRRIVRCTLASAVIYAVLSVVSGVLVAADDSKLMLVVKCGALGVAAFGIYVLLMGHDLIIKKGNRT